MGPRQQPEPQSQLRLLSMTLQEEMCVDLAGTVWAHTCLQSCLCLSNTLLSIPLVSEGKGSNLLVLKDSSLHFPLLLSPALRRPAGFGCSHSSGPKWICKRSTGFRDGNDVQGLLAWKQLRFSQWLPSHNGPWLWHHRSPVGDVLRSKARST